MLERIVDLLLRQRGVVLVASGLVVVAEVQAPLATIVISSTVLALAVLPVVSPLLVRRRPEEAIG